MKKPSKTQAELLRYMARGNRAFYKYHPEGWYDWVSISLMNIQTSTANACITSGWVAANASGQYYITEQGKKAIE